MKVASISSPGLSSNHAILATMHRKEQVIAPAFASSLGMAVTVPSNFDSDRFGTFTRDIARTGNQLEAARRKAQAVLDLTGETVAIASEGAFFPHPVIPGLACNREILLLLDRPNDLEIVGECLSYDTNFAHCTVNTVEAALEFANQAKFPSHGLVIMSQPITAASQETHLCIHKGIQDQSQLIHTVEVLLEQSPDGSVHLETDMRAFVNPTRMTVIEQATQDLIQKIQQTCPECSCPGFAVVDTQRGLPCQWCHQPTDLLLAEIYQCQRCRYSHSHFFPQQKQTADPAYCAYCNP